MLNKAHDIPAGLLDWARHLYDESRERTVTLRDNRWRAVELYIPFDRRGMGLRHYRLCRRRDRLEVLLAEADDHLCEPTNEQRRALEELFRHVDESEAGIDFAADPASDRICT